MTEDKTPHIKENGDKQPRFATFKTRLHATFIDSLLTLPLIFIFYNKDTVNQPIPAILQDKLLELQQGHASSGDVIRATLDYWISSGEFTAMLLRSTSDFTLMGICAVLFWIYRSATPGKMLYTIKIADANSYQKPSKKQLIIRYLGYIPSTIFFGIGFLWVIFDKKKQAWHDKLSNTVVIHTKPDEYYSKSNIMRRQSMLFIPILITLIVILYIKYG